MSISSSTTKNTYSGDGSTTVFPYTFEILAQGDMLVQTKVNSTGVITTNTITTEYTISGAGVSTGGNVTFVTAPASGTTVILLRNVSYLQPSHYSEYDPLPSVTLETNLDRLTMLCQQLSEIASRNVKVDAGVDTDVFNTTLPTPSDGGLYLATNSTGTGFVFNSITSTGSYIFGAGVGILAQTSTGNSAVRTLTGTANEVTVTSGTGAAANPTFSLPAALTFTSKTVTGGTYNALTQTVASATTTDLSATTSNSIIISGTTTITGFGTVAAGAIRNITFSGALLLTYNATSLLIPGAANITTAANDSCRIESLGSGNWQVLSYTTYANRPVRGKKITAFTGSGTFTTDLNCIRARVRMIAGGGAGGSTAAGAVTADVGAGGGGAGAYIEAILTAAQLGTSQTVTIGAAGAAGGAGFNTGGTGGTTSLGALLSCTGGLGGTRATGATSTAMVLGGLGGTPTVSTGTAIISAHGYPGGNGFNGAGTTGAPSGYGGNSPFGAGGLSVGTINTGGTAGLDYGTGGSGSVSANADENGGAGVIGYMIIEEDLG